MPEIVKTTVINRVLSTKSPYEFEFFCCEFTKVILYSKSWCEMYVLKHSDICTNHIKYV